MSNTVQEIYAQMIRTLPPSDRLRLATLILNDLVEPTSLNIDQSDTWTEQDQVDLTAFSLQSAAAFFPDDEAIEQRVG